MENSLKHTWVQNKQQKEKKTYIAIKNDNRGMSVCVTDSTCGRVWVGVRSKVEWGAGDVAGGRHGGGRDRGGRGSRAVI